MPPAQEEMLTVMFYLPPVSSLLCAGDNGRKHKVLGHQVGGDEKQSVKEDRGQVDVAEKRLESGSTTQHHQQALRLLSVLAGKD